MIILIEMENPEYEDLDYQNLLKKFKLYKCISYILMAWENVSKKCITNCFQKAFINSKISTLVYRDCGIIDNQAIDNNELEY
ncbi:hypothetical protein A3Q56_06406 [Intoshia linei]|uniref:Uncharacterized protein n=1 Tax=Intoshia linei TaxID=1819745 RepID=A0A177AWJ9_9BILA|nr:hypothetical protein A3Q56_06406 [Intoshia linei]